MNPTTGTEITLATGWRISRVDICLNSADKDSLLLFLEQRYMERFFEPIRTLKGARTQLQGHGFAIMALCSLVIESLQCYRDGLPSTHKDENRALSRTFNPPLEYRIPYDERKTGIQAFADFFSHNNILFPNVDGVLFYKAIRNGLLHQAQTKQGWRIRSGRPELWSKTDMTVDRTKFANALEKSFEQYIEELRAAAWDDPIWLKARRKIWWLIKLSS